jgi:hypothetical protein
VALPAHQSRQFRRLATSSGLAESPSRNSLAPGHARFLVDDYPFQPPLHMRVANVRGYGLWREAMASIYSTELWHMPKNCAMLKLPA